MSHLYEEQTLNQLLGAREIKWRNQKISWCNLCNCSYFVCEKCGSNSCSGTGCEYCLELYRKFKELRFHIFDYLTDQEIKMFNKINKLIELIPLSITLNQVEIDWNSPEIKERLSTSDELIFKEEIEKLL